MGKRISTIGSATDRTVGIGCRQETIEIVWTPRDSLHHHCKLKHGYLVQYGFGWSRTDPLSEYVVARQDVQASAQC